MSNEAAPAHKKPAKGIIGRFLSFDNLIGSGLIKVMYYIGLAGIIVSTLITMVIGGANIAGGTAGDEAYLIVVIPIMALVSLVFWRFICEVSLLSFLAYNRLGEVRDALNEHKRSS